MTHCFTRFFTAKQVWRNFFRGAMSPPITAPAYPRDTTVYLGFRGLVLPSIRDDNCTEILWCKIVVFVKYVKLQELRLQELSEVAVRVQTIPYVLARKEHVLIDQNPTQQQTLFDRNCSEARCCQEATCRDFQNLGIAAKSFAWFGPLEIWICLPVSWKINMLKQQSLQSFTQLVLVNCQSFLCASKSCTISESY